MFKQEIDAEMIEVIQISATQYLGAPSTSS